MKEVTETPAKVREFIWEHWKSQTQGTVKFEAYSKEGERTVAEYRVKYAENERCKLIAKTDSELRGRGKFSTEKFSKYDEFVAEFVERVKIPRDYSSKRKSISKEANQSAKFYWIQLKEAAGKVLSEL